MLLTGHRLLAAVACQDALGYRHHPPPLAGFGEHTYFVDPSGHIQQALGLCSGDKQHAERTRAREKVLLALHRVEVFRAGDNTGDSEGNAPSPDGDVDGIAGLVVMKAGEVAFDEDFAAPRCREILPAGDLHVIDGGSPVRRQREQPPQHRGNFGVGLLDFGCLHDPPGDLPYPRYRLQLVQQIVAGGIKSRSEVGEMQRVVEQ